MTIYLTETDRAAYMEALATTVPDLDIVSYLNSLNAIPGVCTVMSCLGWHGQGNFTMGYVCLHLSEEKVRLLESAANDLPNFCKGYASGLDKEWTYSTHVRSRTDEVMPCVECEPVHCRGRCQPVVWHTVKWSGRVCLAALAALIELLNEGSP